MLFRLVRPVQRKRSRFPQYVRRIPADVRSRAVGTRLNIPLGDITVPKTISEKMDDIRVSLRTNDPAEVKVRQGAVDAYLENIWKALRADQPVSLTHQQAAALAGRLYRAWVKEEDGRTIAIQYMPGGADPVYSRGLRQEEREAVWQHIEEKWTAIRDDGSPEKLEEHLGPIIDSYLLSEGIGCVDDESRLRVLDAFAMALPGRICQPQTEC